MDEMSKNEIKFLRSLSSKEGARWLLSTYPPSPTNMIVPIAIGHVNWQKEEQILLAERYLSQGVFASGRGYREMLATISLRTFLSAIKKTVRNYPKERIGLLKYNLAPELIRAAKTDKQKEMVDRFIDETFGA